MLARYAYLPGPDLGPSPLPPEVSIEEWHRARARPRKPAPGRRLVALVVALLALSVAPPAALLIAFDSSALVYVGRG